LAAARAGAPDRSVIVADFQTAGKGRIDRRWEATRGTNLLVSLLFRAEPRATKLVALACRAACATLTSVEPALKWPNDLIIESKKLAGLLAVASPADDFIVVGIGVNVGWAPDGAVALRDVWRAPVTPYQLLAEMLRRIDELAAESASQSHSRYVQALGTLGQRVRVDLISGDNIVGDAFDVDESARLLVRDDAGVVHTMDVGDVVHLRTTA
jgi:BirA family biotin operon repressor/biotin-[acetyl-CoA-carboxylase] ligase